MKDRKYIKIPQASWIMRLNSLFLSLLYFIALSFPSLNVIISILIGWGILLMAVSTFSDKEYSYSYKILIVGILIVAYALIIYGLFWSTKYEQINAIISIVGLGVSCGSVIVIGIVIIFMKKRLETIQKYEEITQRFIDAVHMLALYVIPLCKL